MKCMGMGREWGQVKQYGIIKEKFQGNTMAAQKSEELMNALRSKGYPEEFCEEITYKYLNTDYTTNRMIGYLNKFPTLKIEDCVDEMLAILADRDRFVEKHKMEHAQQIMNEVYRYGLGND